ncbi:glutamate-5-semialdehyde dehydrogenase [Sphingobacterium sp. CZ-2]|uniref:glutamate-5-semialdehyde dehydrogenase n=1 Tax=Sphingobacterium sp. CZ-2 TaxID=2557994 RepID=UPI00106FB955|nr:glutamate-5-semialdehyde dehydrogenase [Sphingobacterium sp. CZ-2]QBR10912.1 glutamate-5-semialdehyde dehydrogenase [Sphingobacterium sp. CZ-2]
MKNLEKEDKVGIQAELEQARQAKCTMASMSNADRQEVLKKIASSLLINKQLIIQENQKDLAKLDDKDPKRDRLLLDEPRIEQMASSILEVSKLDDPTGQMLLERELPNGLLVRKETVALGVIAVIYESRPNVTIDVASLCLRSANICLLRGGSDAWYSNSCLVEILKEVLVSAGCNPHLVQLLPVEREYVEELLHARSYVDLIIPRGSQSLINYVREHAKVPVIETGAGVCHTYVDETADLDMAANIIANAKISRPSVCNALDTILVDALVLNGLLERLAPKFESAKVEVLADAISYPVWKSFAYQHLGKATEDDFGREFLDLICSMKVVNGLEEALEHIAHYSSKHSECIVSQNPKNIATFMKMVDAAAVYANASTRFTDGGVFGLGAEIGISTQKLHARGPFALEKLVCEKWFINGQGQIR